MCVGVEPRSGEGAVEDPDLVEVTAEEIDVPTEIEVAADPQIVGAILERACQRDVRSNAPSSDIA